ncbi:MAG: SDR family oxidoreductase [Ktedonobacteraceae bacterium]|nr:SDR family oxidoreductase [Ktedonobacteraceae bacterium]
MPNEINSESEKAQPLAYQIRIKGHLGSAWTDWFSGLTITTLDNGETLLTGPVVDQAALHGLLRKVRDVAMPLVSVIRVKPDPADASDVNQAKEQVVAMFEERTLLKNLPTVVDTARLAAFLASDGARVLTGTIVNASSGSVID